jgi:cell division protein FtsQ
MKKTASAGIAAVPFDVRATRLAADALLVLGGGAFVALALLWGAHSPLFSFRALTLHGDVLHNSVPVIRTQVLPKLKGNYFTIDLREARRAFETVPWVRRATVRRVWPNRLDVTLEQHRATAYWERDDGDPHLVNLQGEVFEVNLGDVEEEQLPTLSGPDGSSALVWQMYRRLGPVFGTLGQRVEQLGLSARGSWQARLDSGTRIELGRGSADEVVDRTQRYAATVGQVAARYQREGRSVEYADLRHQDAYALRLRGVSTTPRDAAPPPQQSSARRGRR